MTDSIARALPWRVASGTAGPKAAPSDDSAESSRALEAVYREHVAFVWRVARRYGVPIDAIEDVVHDVFLVVRRRLPELLAAQGDELRGRLFMIARGIIANDRRGRERREARDGHGLAVAPAPDPERFIAGVEAVAWVERFLAGLPETQRVVFELVDIEGLRGPEVARATGAALDTVYSRLRLARAAFARFVAALREGRCP